MAYLPDHEPYLGGRAGRVRSCVALGYGIAQQANVLFHDSQYFEHGTARHVGWGRFRASPAVAFGLAAKVERLICSHDPPHGHSARRARRPARERCGATLATRPSWPTRE